MRAGITPAPRAGTADQECSGRQPTGHRLATGPLMLLQQRSPQLSGTFRLRVADSSGPSPESRPQLLPVLLAVMVSASASVSSGQTTRHCFDQDQRIGRKQCHWRIQSCVSRQLQSQSIHSVEALSKEQRHPRNACSGVSSEAEDDLLACL